MRFCGKCVKHFLCFQPTTFHFRKKSVVTAYKYSRHFTQNENIFLHKILESNRNDGRQPLSPHPLTIASDQINLTKYSLFSNSSIGEVFVQFHSLAMANLTATKKLTIEHGSYAPVINEVVDSLKRATDTEIEAALFDYCLWPRTRSLGTTANQRMWKTLDDECCSRLCAWELDLQFRVADYFFHCSLSRVSLYSTKLIEHLSTKLDVMHSRDVIQMLFFVMMQRNVSTALMAAVESRIFLSFSDLSIDELGIVCLAFYKTKTKMNCHQLVYKLFERITPNLSNTHDIILGASFKQLCYSSIHEQSTAVEKLLVNCIPFLNRWSVPVLVRLCLLGSEIGVYNREILRQTNDHILGNVKNIRFKDLIKVFHANCFYGCQVSKCFIDTVIQEIKLRKKEVEDYPSSVIEALVGLSFINVYPQELLNKVFYEYSSETTPTKWTEFSRELACLDCCIEIENPQYKGQRMDVQQRNEILQHGVGRIPNRRSTGLTYQETFQLDILEVLQGFANPRPCRLFHILPHYFRPDIVFCSNASGHFADYPKTWRHSKSHILHPTGAVKFTAVFAYGFLKLGNESQLWGSLKRKIRQLNALGYRVMALDVSEYRHLPPLARRDIIKEKIKAFLK